MLRGGVSRSRRWCAVRRYLIVANQTLGGDQLLEAIRERMAAGPSHFHLLVPATAAAQLDAEYLASVAEPSGPAAGPGAEGLDREQARHLLEDELEEATHAESGEDAGRRLADQDPAGLQAPGDPGHRAGRAAGLNHRCDHRRRQKGARWRPGRSRGDGRGCRPPPFAGTPGGCSRWSRWRCWPASWCTAPGWPSPPGTTGSTPTCRPSTRRAWPPT